MTSRRIGLLGGTFDPIHNGHLSIARDVQRLLKLDEVRFIPASHPPLKEGARMFSPELRLELVTIAIDSIPSFSTSDLEYHREGPSYTVDTIREILTSENLEPQELFFILGIDAFLSIEKWHRHKELFSCMNFVVIDRPNGGSGTCELSSIAARLGFCYNELKESCRYSKHLKECGEGYNDSQSPLQDLELKEKGHDGNTLHSPGHSRPSQLENRAQSLSGQISPPNKTTISSGKGEDLPRMTCVYTNSENLAIHAANVTPVPVSSTDIREKLRSGISIHSLVPARVYERIVEEANNL